jgi:protein-disulfide isomerase
MEHNSNEQHAPVESAPEIREEKEEKKEGLNLPTAILVASILISTSLFYVAWSMSKGGSAPTPTIQVNPGAQAEAGNLPPVDQDDVILGNSDAPITLIEYGDYKCSFCKRFFTETEPVIKEKYVKSGQVRMIYRDFAFLGPESVAAAEAAHCAKDQGKFWAFHDSLYMDQSGSLDRNLFLQIAANLNMNVPSFTACVDGKKYAETVARQTQTGQGAGVNATPSFFLVKDGQEPQFIQGAQPTSVFETAIQGLL